MRSSSLFKNKMRSESGATLMTALLFFIMCAVCGSVILAAASAAAGRMSRQQSSDQAYYTVTSAAKLLRDEIDGKSITVKKTVIETEQEAADGSGSSGTSGNPTYEYTPGTETVVKDAVQHFIENASNDVFTKSLQLTPVTEGVSDDVKTAITRLMAYAIFSMDSNYEIQIVVSDKSITTKQEGTATIVDTSKLNPDQYYAVLKLKPVKKESESSKVDKSTGKDENGNETTTSETTTVTTTELSWEGATIEKYSG